MAARNIPEVGEIFAGYVPGRRSLLHVTVGVSSASPDVALDEVEATPIVNITEPVVIFGLWTVVQEALTTSTLDLGDSDDPDRYSADTTIATASTGAVLVAGSGLSVPYVNSGPLNIDATIAGATMSTGLVDVYVDYAILED